MEINVDYICVWNLRFDFWDFFVYVWLVKEQIEMNTNTNKTKGTLVHERG